MNYAEMSDFDIDLAVFQAKFGPIGSDKDMWRVWKQGKFRPCESWADAGPIIEKYRITIMPASQGENWMAQAFEYALTDVSARPLRSAMIVFLMMQESK